MVINSTKFKEIVPYYSFYDTPDGEECLPKTYYYTKYGAMAGAVFSMYEMILNSHPTTLHSAIARFGRFTLPMAGMGFAFGSSICLLAHIRKKDDVANHVIAGMLAGSVWGFKYNRIYTGHVWAVYMGVLAGVIKYFHVLDIDMFASRKEHSKYFDPRFDFEIKLYDDPGRPNEA